MNRDQLIEKARQALSVWDGLAPNVHLDMARAVVDAILPQVTTAEELEALQTPALVRGDDGQVWQRFPHGWDCLSEDGTGGAYPSTKVATCGPLTVVWRPRP